MKKIKNIFLLLLLIFTLASCGEIDKAIDTTIPTISPTEDINKPTVEPSEDDNKPTLKPTEDNNRPTNPDDEIFQVRFVTNSDLVLPTQTIRRGDKVQKPMDPVKYGYTFDGWYLGDEKWVFAGYPVTEDMTLVAHFNRIVCKVTIDAENGSLVQKKEFYYGQKIVLPTPTRHDYIFVNWVDSNGVVVDNNYVVEGNVKIIAVWDNKFTIKFDTSGGIEINDKTAYLNRNVILPIPVRTNSKFLAWYLDGEKVEEPFNYIYTKNITLKAYWRVTSGDYEYDELVDGTIKIIKYNGNDITIEIPNVIDNKRVTSIGTSAFSGNKTAKTIKLSEYIESVEDSAFSDCPSLENVIFNDNVIDYGKAIFDRCDNLSTVEIRNNVELMSLFTDENQLPDNLKVRIKYNINDKEIVSKKLLANMDFRFGVKYQLIEFVGDWETIPSNSFYKTFVKSVVIPQGVKSISDNAFFTCYGLINVVIPSSVTSIGSKAFFNCYDLINVFYAGTQESWNRFESDAFDNSSKKINIEYESKVNEFSYINSDKYSYLLTNNNKVIFLDLHDNESTSFDFNSDFAKYEVISIGDYAFARTKLKSITFPDELINIGNNAFLECEQLYSIVIPEGVKSICELAFFNCVNLTSIRIPKTIKHLGDGSLGCANLANIFYSGTKEDWEKLGFNSYLNIYIEYESMVNDLSYVENEKFRYVKTNTNKIIIIECMDNNATIINLEKEFDGFEIIRIGIKAFYSLDNLISIEIPKEVKSIGSEAFSWCQRLQNVVISNGVEYIDRNVFQSCYNLRNVVIPSSVKYIGAEVFQDCRDISNVFYGGTEDEWEKVNNSYFSTGGLYMEYESPINKLTYTNNGKFSYCIANTNDIIVLSCLDKNINTVDLEKEFSGYNVKYMSTGVFFKCINLKNITIPEGVIYIGPEIFYGCTNLASVVILNGLKNINYSSFANCTSLITIELPESLTSIMSSAFKNCVSLESITLPKNITSIGMSAFLDCSSLKSIILKENITEIGGSAFEGCSSLINIELSENLNEIGESAFKDCSSLTSIIIPENIKNIGYNFFSGCSKLTNVTLPEGITYIGDGAFRGCSSLTTSIVIPKEQDEIYRETFLGCSSLPNVIIPESITAINQKVFEGCSSLTNIVIPKNVDFLGYNTFKGCSNLKNVTLPEGITGLGDNVFEDCYSLNEILIPNSVTYLGVNAFKGCSSLKKAVLPEGIDIIRNSTFLGCSSLKSVSIPDSIKRIAYKAFSECKNLIGINIPVGIEIIKNSTFLGCSKLTSVIIPRTVKVIEENAFKDCTKISNVFYNGNYDDWLSIDRAAGNNSLDCINLEFDSTVVELTVVDNEKYNYITTNNNEIIFANCKDKNITSFDFEHEFSGMNIIICNSAFEKNISLIDVKFSKDVKIVGNNAFSGCTSLRNLTILGGLKIIGASAFEDCSSLRSVTLPEGLKIIGASAFEDCSSLRSVTLQEGLTDIEEHSFARCSSLTAIILPKSLITIGKSVFAECTGLTNIFYGGVKENWWNLIGSNLRSMQYIIDYETPVNKLELVDNEKYSYIKTNTNDAIFVRSNDKTISTFDFEKEFAGLNVITIGVSAFEDCNILKSIIIPEGVTYLGDYGFKKCINLESIKLPSTLRYIGVYSFSTCEKLKEIKVPVSVQIIGYGAFALCDNLTIFLHNNSSPRVYEERRYWNPNNRPIKLYS